MSMPITTPPTPTPAPENPAAGAPTPGAAPVPTPPPATPPATPEPTDQLPPDHPLVRAYQAQKNELKDLRPYKQRVAEIEDSQRTEAQRAAHAAAEAQRERDEARAEALRYQVAAKHGVGEDYFDLLGSGDEETLNGRGERLSALIAARQENELLKAQIAALQQGKPAPSQLRPVAALKPGATPQGQPSEDDELYRSLFGDS